MFCYVYLQFKKIKLNKTTMKYHTSSRTKSQELHFWDKENTYIYVVLVLIDVRLLFKKVASILFSIRNV